MISGFQLSFCETAEKCLNLYDPAGLDNGNGDTVDGDKERACDSLLMCFVTMINHGLRNGGGIGDVLRSPSNKVQCPTCAMFKRLLFNSMRT